MEQICLPIGRFFVKLACVTSTTRSSKAAPRRRPKQGGYARGDETRAQIITTALRVFGESGFEQAATRSIAAKAGVTPPALQYYFDSKDGLHRACAQYIIDRALPRLQPVIDLARAAVRAGVTTDALDALDSLLDALTDNLSEPGAESWCRFVVRSKHDGAGPGLEMLRERISVPMFDAVTGLIGVITGQPPAGDETRIRALLVLGQVNWMHARREEALKILNWSKLDAARIAAIKQIVRVHTRRALADLNG
jgi:AcrR family transcriptional regulator